jgi:hypothetical protein
MLNEKEKKNMLEYKINQKEKIKENRLHSHMHV